MSLKLSRFILAHAASARSSCPRIATFQVDDLGDGKDAALAELRARGWHYSAGRVLCPGHQDPVAES